MLAGLRMSRGQAVVLMDADLQHPRNSFHGCSNSTREGTTKWFRAETAQVMVWCARC